MAFTFVISTSVWAAPSTLNEAVTLQEVRTDAKTSIKGNPQDEKSNYQYDINGTPVIDINKDTIGKDDFKYIKDGNITNLGINDTPSYIVEGSNNRDYNVANGDNILESDYTVTTSKGNISLDTITTDENGDLSKNGYTYSNGIDLSVSALDRVNNGVYKYTDKNGNEYSLQVIQDANGDYIGVMPKNLINDTVAVNNANVAFGNFTNDQTAYNTAYETWTNDNQAYKDVLTGYNNDILKQEQYNEEYQTFLSASNQYGTFATDTNNYNNYTNSLGGIIDNRAEAIAKQTVSDAINGELDELNGIVGKVGQNETAVETNRQNIATNTANIETNRQNIATNTANIETNRQNIATNTANIETNRQNIATNTANIETNRQNIATNTANIETNRQNIATNTANIETNRQNIATNTANIETNRQNIATNTANIETNRQNIATNTANIETNRQNIAINTANIETNRQSISDLRSDFKVQNARNEARFAQVEKKIEEVNDEMNKGLASTAALASLVPLSGRYRTQLSLGMGGYRDKQAIAAGGYHYLAGNVLLNAGLAWGGDDSISYKAGVTYGF